MTKEELISELRKYFRIWTIQIEDKLVILSCEILHELSFSLFQIVKLISIFDLEDNYDFQLHQEIYYRNINENTHPVLASKIYIKHKLVFTE